MCDESCKKCAVTSKKCTECHNSDYFLFEGKCLKALSGECPSG